MGSLKREFLELLEKDLEFRYAVAGYLGLSEILKRLDIIAEEQKNLRMEQASLREEQTKIWMEIVAIKEEQKSLREEQTKVWSEIASLREEQVKLRMEQTKIWMEIAAIKEEQKNLREEQTKIWGEIARIWEEIKALREEQVKLREDFNRMLVLIDRMDNRLSRVERTLEKLTIDVEDEAKSFLKHRLRELGISVELTSLILPDLELNIYGASEDVCVVGEATVRAGVGTLEELIGKFEKLRREYPERLRRRIILVIYASLPTAELVEEARSRGVWLLKATEEFHRPEKLFIEV
jgi:chromosome segregation ATPase